MIALLTEAEVAERLRCSVSKIRKLRYDGRMAFIPGRPVLVLEREVEAYERRQAEKRAEKERQRRPKRRPPGTKQATGMGPEMRGILLGLRQRFAREWAEKVKG
jgi:excisionase family DNA binding protein